MSNGLALDNHWIENTIADVESSASTVAVVETSDPTRESQFVAYVLGNYSAVFHYGPWNGLEQWNPLTGHFEPVTLAAHSDYDAGLRNEVRDMTGALRHMDGILRQRRVAFLIRGVDRCDGSLDKNTDLINAFRAWALNSDIMASKSLICLFSAQPDKAVDHSTLELATFARPNLATEAERLEIVRSVTSISTRVNVDRNAQRVLAVAAAGLNLHQTKAVLLKAYNTTKLFEPTTVKHFKSDYIRRSDVVEIEEPDLGFADVGGYESVKEIVRNSLIRAIQHPERAHLAAMPLPRGLLLYGPPGTGKTLFAKSLARETNLPFINLKTENLFTSLLGETGQRMRDAIRIAEQASPALVFVDEIDRFGRRSSNQTDGASQETSRVFSQVLEWLGDKNRKSIVVGTTNVPEHMDDAILRSGRFSYIVPFLYPNQKARLHILRLHLGLDGNRPKPAMDGSSVMGILPRLAEKTEYYSGADLEELVVRAKRRFFEGESSVMKGDDLAQAHADFRVPVEKRQGILQRYRELGSEFANSMALLDEYERGG